MPVKCIDIGVGGGGGVLLESKEKISREGEIFILKGGWFDKFERAKIS